MSDNIALSTGDVVPGTGGRTVEQLLISVRNITPNAMTLEQLGELLTIAATTMQAGLRHTADLREQLAAMTEERDAWRVRAERDGAALAAVPVKAIDALVKDTATRRQIATIQDWLDAQPLEAQP